MGKLLNRVGRYVAVLPLLILCAIPACDEDPSGTEDGNMQVRIRVYSGDNQTERTGATLSEPLVAQVRNIVNAPQPGIQVLFAATDPGGSVIPTSATTGSDGLASCAYTLGTGVGEQRVKAIITGEDSVFFTVNAVQAGCAEENPSKICNWRSDRVYITTTSSTLLDAVGTVLIEYDPETGDAVELLEASEFLLDISFSSRGELYVCNVERLFKVDPVLYLLSIHTSFPVQLEQEFKPNGGGILAGVTNAGPLAVTCQPQGYFYIDLPTMFQNLSWECLAAHPVTRDLYVVTSPAGTAHQIWRVIWDGRAASASSVSYATINAGTATPRGMDIDSTGTLYISFDSDDVFRRVVRVLSNGTVDDDFVDFYAAAGGNAQLAGRWGDIAYGGGKLYLIDTRNNRLAVITAETGALTLLDEDFRLSKSGAENERYGIAVRPPWMCAGSN